MNGAAIFEVGGLSRSKAAAAKNAPAFDVSINEIKFYGQTGSDAAPTAAASSAKKSPSAAALQEENNRLRQQVEELTNTLAEVQLKLGEATQEASASDPPPPPLIRSN